MATSARSVRRSGRRPPGRVGAQTGVREAVWVDRAILERYVRRTSESSPKHKMLWSGRCAERYIWWNWPQRVVHAESTFRVVLVHSGRPIVHSRLGGFPPSVARY